MKKYLYTTGTIAFALAVSGAPLLARADDSGTSASADVTVSVTAAAEADSPEAGNSQSSPRPTIAQLRALMASTSANITPEMRKRAEDALNKAQRMEQDYMSASTSSARATTSAEVRAQVEEMKQLRTQIQDTFTSELEQLRAGSTTPAQTVAQLKQLILERRTALGTLIASSTPIEKKVLEHASAISVAVHALRASKDLLGGIGQQVSDIAQGVDDSLATTTSAEAQIEGRGFWTRLFFGGDTNAATTISEQVAQNQERVTQLADLLNQASTSAEVKTELQAQLEALNAEQVRLQAVASSQQKLWGLFSWRL